MPRPRKDIKKQLAVVVKDFIEQGSDVADIGVIIGCLGKDSSKWLDNLKKECTSVGEFIEMARTRADIALVAAAVEAAVGYDYLEEDVEYFKCVQGNDVNGKPRIVEKEGKRKVKKRHAKKNDALLKFILKNRLPEFFSDTQRIEINKKSIEIKEITAAEIKKFAGKLLDTIQETGDGKGSGAD